VIDKIQNNSDGYFWKNLPYFKLFLCQLSKNMCGNHHVGGFLRINFYLDWIEYTIFGLFIISNGLDSAWFKKTSTVKI